MILMGTPGFNEILILALVVGLLFGASRIPHFMKGLGQGIKELKSSLTEADKAKEELEEEKWQK